MSVGFRLIFLMLAFYSGMWAFLSLELMDPLQWLAIAALLVAVP